MTLDNSASSPLPPTGPTRDAAIAQAVAELVDLETRLHASDRIRGAVADYQRRISELLNTTSWRTQVKMTLRQLEIFKTRFAHDDLAHEALTACHRTIFEHAISTDPSFKEELEKRAQSIVDAFEAELASCSTYDDIVAVGRRYYDAREDLLAQAGKTHEEIGIDTQLSERMLASYNTARAKFPEAPSHPVSRSAHNDGQDKPLPF